MTNTEPGSCASCGRQRWVGDKFCAGCGRQHYDVDGDTSPSLLDLDHDVARAESPPKSSRRESLLGLGALVAVIALVALFFVAGNDAAEDLAENRLENPFPEGTPTPTPEATATPRPTREPIPSTGTDAESPTPPTPTPTTIELAEFISTADLGEGWLVTGADRQYQATDLTSGETIEIDVEGGTNGAATYVLPEGVITRSVSGRASYTSWGAGGSPYSAGLVEIGTLDLGSSLLFIDESAGPVVVDFGFEFFGDLTAIALETGETQAIAVADPLNSIIAHFGFGFPGPQAPGVGFLSDDGQNVFSWSWSDGWTKIAEGQLSSIEGMVAVVSRCEGPDNCPTRLVNGAGDELGRADSGLLTVSFNNSVRLNPEQQVYAELAFSPGPSGVAEIKIVGLDGQLRHSIPADGTTGSWQALDSWSPNGRFLFAATSRGLAAIDVETGELTWLEANARVTERGGSNNGTIIFIDEIVR